MTHFLQLMLVLVCSCVVVAAPGCGANRPQEAVQPDLARNTLAQVLDGWKNGQSPDEWRKNDPEIVIQDQDWMSGAKLLEYEIMGPGQPRDANLYCDVKLTLQKSGQKSVIQSVTYVVGTDPVLTVFRAL